MATVVGIVIVIYSADNHSLKQRPAMEPIQQNALIGESELRSLTGAIDRFSDQLNAHIKWVREIEEEMCNKFDQIAKDHEKQVELRIERLNQQYARMQNFADEHHKLFDEECVMLQQLQAGGSEKDNSLAQLKNMLDEARSKLAESEAEKNELANRLSEANDKLAMSVAEETERAGRLADANNKLHAQMNELARKLDAANNKRTECEADLEMCRLQLKTSRQLASSTKLRQLKELAVTEEINAVISRLMEDKAALQETIKKREAVTVYSEAVNTEETDDGNTLDDLSSGLPGQKLYFV